MKEQAVLAARRHAIEKEVRKQRGVIYGSNAIKKQTGFFARTPSDYDISVNNPKEAAKALETRLDKKSEGNYYYSKPSKHKGTWKVKHIGNDLKKGSDDDLHIADFSRARDMESKQIGGTRFAKLHEIYEDKVSSLRNPNAFHRHKKDFEDSGRILGFWSTQPPKRRFK